MNLTESLHGIGVYLVYVMIIFLLVLTLLFVKKIKVDKSTFLLINIFIISSGFSSLINSDLKLLFFSIVLYLLYIVSCILLPSLKINFNKYTVNALWLSHFPIIIIPFAIYGIDSSPYKGIFYNSNSLGTITATIFVVAYSILLKLLDVYANGFRIKFFKKKVTINIIILALFFYLTIISASRTSFLTIIICILIGLFCFIFNLLRNKKILSIRNLFISAISICIIYLFISLTSLDNLIIEMIISKFDIRASGRSGLLSYRDQIWLNTIKEVNLFGNGDDFFVNLGYGAHNTFISILGRYGWISMISFGLLVILFVIKSLKYSLSQTNNYYKYLPLMTSVCFLFMSMGEDMLFKAIMLIMFFSVGTILKEEGHNKTKKRI